MSEFSNFSENQELNEWLASLQKSVNQSKAKEFNDTGSNKFKVKIPVINMAGKFRQVNDRVYPEMQGSINFLLVSNGKERVTKLKNVYQFWCPKDPEMNYGYQYKLLEPDMYKDEAIRAKVIELRSRAKALIDSKKYSWQDIRSKNYSLIKAFVLSHRNTGNDLIASDLYYDGKVVEHKYFPAVIVIPNLSIDRAINDDLGRKNNNPAAYALACYTDAPLDKRNGWISLTVRDSRGFGYDVSLSTDILNPITNPEGIIPSKYMNTLETEGAKALLTEDPVRLLLNRNQLSDTEYSSMESLEYADSYLSWLENGKSK